MMRNKFGGLCYRCSEYVDVGGGHFERINGRWRVQHAKCAIKFRGVPDPERDALRPARDAARLARITYIAQQTGRKARKARKLLRDMASTSPSPTSEMK